MAIGKILVVRLGAMGDILHALPAVATLKHSFPQSHLTWLVEPQWMPLLEGNPFVDEFVAFDRSSWSGFRASLRQLRSRYDLAVDFQSLLKSAILATLAKPERLFGFERSYLREPLAALFYSHTAQVRGTHKVEHNLALAAAAGATNQLIRFPVPPGEPEGELPDGDFVLSSPLAGWGSKQWPLEHFAQLARMLKERCGVPLVLNVPANAAAALRKAPEAIPYVSKLPGLIDATRRATAVVGVDSGPLHLAAALQKPGVAIYGPTEPARNGPYGGSFRVLRQPDAVTTYKRRQDVDTSMLAITPEAVLAELISVGFAKVRSR